MKRVTMSTSDTATVSAPPREVAMELERPQTSNAKVPVPPKSTAGTSRRSRAKAEARAKARAKVLVKKELDPKNLAEEFIIKGSSNKTG